MSSLIYPAIQSFQPFESAIQIRQERLKELNVLFDLSQDLGLIEPLDSLLGRVAHDVVRITQASYCRLLTIENDGTFFLRASCNNRVELTEAQMHQNYTLPGLMEHLWLMRNGSPMVVCKTDPGLSLSEIEVLGLDKVSKAWLAPLQVGTEPFGVLVLGDDRENLRKEVTKSWMDLVAAISELAGNVVHRARFHVRLEGRYIQTIWSLAKTIDKTDPYSEDHGVRTAELVVAEARQLGCDTKEMETFHLAGLLHDIGKVNIPEQILQKPGRLTAEEWEIMKKHPLLGVEILSPVSKYTPILPIVRAHHEKFDGSGYPFGLRGEEIPLGARILSVADAYSAMTAGRVYRTAISEHEAVAELKRCQGAHFDPRIVNSFIEIIGKKL
jgi:putative nucleotidyltransferase with HDIG domain